MTLKTRVLVRKTATGFIYVSFGSFHNHLTTSRLRFQRTDLGLKRGYFYSKKADFRLIPSQNCQNFTQTKVGV